MPKTTGYYWARYKMPNQTWEVVYCYISDNWSYVTCVGYEEEIKLEKFEFVSDTPLQEPADANG